MSKNKLNPKEYYQQELHKHKELLHKYTKKHQLFTIARLFVFLSLLATIFWLNWGIVMIGTLLIELILFVYLVNCWLDVKILVHKEKLYININENELQALEGNWSNYDPGNEFKSSKHAFSDDMDLFGEKSVFQYINRTILPLGTQRLAKTLSIGTNDIQLNKEMITELSENINWTQRFIVESKVFLKTQQHLNSLNTIKEQFSEENFGKRNFRQIRWVFPIVTISSFVLYNVNIFSTSTLMWIVLLAFFIIGVNLKLTNAWMNHLETCSDKIKAMNQQIKVFEELKINSELGKEFQKKLIGKMGVLQGLTELELIHKRMEYRRNVIVGVVLNYFFAWDLHLLVHSRSWYKKYVNDLDKWESYLAEIEVWISGAIYRYNQERTCFALPNESQMNIVNLRHPFITKNKSVGNDFTLSKEESFLIITGPNMAGKSTYLRSVGLAILSANAGFPILADSYSLPKFFLYSSMRTNDDLTQNSSYFHAELMRLKFITEETKKNKNVFVILDEILKGTNSKDKAIGSARFLSKLQTLGAKGIIATHDLSLTELAKQSKQFKNMCFDSTIEKDELSFDYKIKHGVCQNMNASFLLKKMDLV